MRGAIVLVVIAAAACGEPSTVAKLGLVRGQAGGVFAAGEARGGPEATTAVRVADLDGDGNPDVVAVGADGDAFVLLGDGAGAFPAEILCAQDVVGAIVGDFDEDGKPDVGVLTSDGVVTILHGEGDGRCGPAIDSANLAFAQTLDAPHVLDLDGDGHLDIVAGGQILYGRGGGAFDEVDVAQGAVPSVGIGDLDGDGEQDLVLSTTGSTPQLSVLYGLGGRAFAPPVIVATDVVMELTVADVDGDGIADIVGLNDGLAILPGVGGRAFGAPIAAGGASFAPGRASLAVVDVDRDGRLDAVIEADADVFVYLAFTAPVSYPANLATPDLSFGLADFDGDGNLDLVLAGG